MPHILQTTAWLATIIYSTIPAFWLAIHPFAKFWRTRPWNPFTALVPLWITLWITVALLTNPYRHIHLYNTPTAWLPAAALFIAGIQIYRRSGTTFTWTQLGGLPEIRPSTPRPLATTGIRAHVRHPIYLAHLLEILAWTVGSGLAVCFALTAIAIATGALMIATEDRELEARFGESFRLYKNNVPAILPRRTPYNPNRS